MKKYLTLKKSNIKVELFFVTKEPNLNVYNF